MEVGEVGNFLFCHGGCCCCVWEEGDGFHSRCCWLGWVPEEGEEKTRMRSETILERGGETQFVVGDALLYSGSRYSGIEEAMLLLLLLVLCRLSLGVVVAVFVVAVVGMSGFVGRGIGDGGG